jgi:hypothetical protein
MTRTAFDATSASDRLAAGSGARASRRSLYVAIYLVSIAVAIVLRLVQLPEQIIADDEWLSLHALLHGGYADVFTHFGARDPCIPLSLYDKLVADTIGLAEWSMRAPMLCAGILSVIVLPLLLTRWMGAKGSLVFQWLLAISPLHVYFSRYARPYAIVFFLVVLGTIAFARWWRSGSIPWAILCALCFIAAPWFELTSLPFVIAPFAFASWVTSRAARASGAAESLAPNGIRRGFWLLAAVVVAGWCALIGPPIVSDGSSLALHSRSQRFELPALTNVYELLSGAELPALAFVSGLVFLFGSSAMLRRQRALIQCFATVIAVEIAVLTAIGPDHIDSALVLVSCAVPMLAAFLWISSMGLVHADDLLRTHWKFPAHAGSVCLCGTLLAFGPLVHSYHSPNNWTNHAIYQLDYSPRFERSYAANVMNFEAVPPVYKRIGEIAGSSFRVVEAPWSREWPSIPYPLYQRLHVRDTLIGFVDDPHEMPGEGELPYGDTRFHFQNFVHVSDFDAMRRANVRFVIFHRGPGFVPDDVRASRAPAVERWRTEYIERVGKPVFDNAKLTVFDLQPTKPAAGNDSR